MTVLTTLQDTTYILGIGGIVFSAYLYFSRPQQKAATNDALLSQRIDLRDQEYQRRFKEMQELIAQSLALAQNHIHTVDTKVDKATDEVDKMKLEIAKLTTIIDERIPKKI